MTENNTNQFQENTIRVFFGGGAIWFVQSPKSPEADFFFSWCAQDNFLHDFHEQLVSAHLSVCISLL